MTEQITLDKALELVSFKCNSYDDWVVDTVKGNVLGDVRGNICGDVSGTVLGDVDGGVSGTINGRHWEFIETPKEKLQRLIKEGADKEELIEALNQLEDN